MLEQSIQNLADAIKFHAETLLKINQPIVSGESKKPEAAKVEDLGNVAEEAPKTRKPRKSKEVVEDEVEAPVAKTEEKKAAPKDELDELDEDDSEETITVESVKNFAKLKIAEGHDRVAIKKMIADLGFDQIADMDEKSLKVLNEQLTKLKKA